MPWPEKNTIVGVIAGGEMSEMSESHILVRLLRMCFPQNWEFGSALSRLGYFRGGGFEHPKPPPRYATAAKLCQVHSVEQKSIGLKFSKS